MRLLTAVCALFCLCFAAPARAVTIDPGQYTGRYYIPGVTGCCLTGVQNVPLAAGTYALDNSSTIGGSSFQFTVDAAGNVSVDSPAAVASGSTLTLQNATIAIKAQAYTGVYILTPFYPAAFTGDHTLVLVPGLTYSIDDGAETGPSAFTFSIDGTGAVSTTSPAATASGSTLSFRTVTIQVDPQAFTAPYYVAAFRPAPSSGLTSLALLPGLQYSLDNGAGLGNSAFTFDVDSAGIVSTSSPAASASGSVLTLANVFVHVDSGCVGTYSISGYPGLQGTVDIVLIPSLAVVVTTPGGASVVVIPTDAFTIPVDCVTLTSVTPYSAAIQPPIKTDGSSVFHANRGVVPVKFTLTANGAATCTLPPATISLTRTSGTSQGLVNQSDYEQASDLGTSFRIDQAACQYVYNLGTSTLGAGQYSVRISINGVVVGAAAFGLQ